VTASLNEFVHILFQWKLPLWTVKVAHWVRQNACHVWGHRFKSQLAYSSSDLYCGELVYKIWPTIHYKSPSIVYGANNVQLMLSSWIKSSILANRSVVPPIMYGWTEWGSFSRYIRCLAWLFQVAQARLCGCLGNPAGSRWALFWVVRNFFFF
jgi:hypothetical protein